MRERLGSILTLALVTMLLGGLTVAGVLFSGAQGTTEVANDATIQIRAEQVLGAAAVSRSLLSQVLLLDAIPTTDRAGESFPEAVARSRASFEELNRRTEALIVMLPATSPIGPAALDLTETGARILSKAESNRPIDDGDVSAFEIAYTTLSREVAAERDARTAAIAAIRDGAAVVANAARFLVAFTIPAASVLAFLGLYRRRQQRIVLHAQLLQEREERVARDEFLAAVSHELRTPLTAVVGFAETLREGRRFLNAGERNELIELLADQARDTAAIVEDLLVLARVNTDSLAVHPESVEIREIVDALALGWSPHDRARITVGGAATLRVDPFRVRQTLRSLIANAIQHGGTLVEVRITPGTPFTRVEIIDDGPGIPPEQRAGIFEPYRKASERPGQPVRIGMGLTVARRLAWLMGGDLTYRFERGQSIFDLTLPSTGQETVQPVADTVVDLLDGIPTADQIVDAIERTTFDVVFQPIVDITGIDEPTVVGYEALARFPSGSPAQWFFAAAESGLRTRLELAAISVAVEKFKNAPADYLLALNLGVETLLSSRLVEVLDPVSPYRVILELSEEATVDNYESARAVLDDLTAKGYRLAIDDIGMGRTDIWHLARLRPDLVKLDTSLVAGIPLDPAKEALVSSVVWLCKGLDARVVAEGVERAEELEGLRRLGIPWAQGYLFGEPGDLPF